MQPRPANHSRRLAHRPPAAQVQEAPDAVPLPATTAGGYDIELRDVAFGYREGADILRSVSLRWGAGRQGWRWRLQPAAEPGALGAAETGAVASRVLGGAGRSQRALEPPLLGLNQRPGRAAAAE
jgi:hypothetical protein